MISSIFQLMIFFPVLLGSSGCDKENQVPKIAAPALNNLGEISYLALGDSYTIGQDVAVDERFPAQTVSVLRQLNFKIKDPLYIATTGWTTQNLINAINQQNPPQSFDIVTLLIGVNDQYQRMDTAGYRIRFTTLLLKSIQLAGNKAANVVVLSIPDYSVTPFVTPADKERVRQDITAFNTINKDVTLSYSISYLDITPSTREGEKDRSLIASDGLHPSGKEYKKWAERLAPVIKDKL